jgi:RNA polymerase sigma-70 factor (ECF subfamily)
MSTATVPELVEHLFRRQSAQIVATLTRGFGSRHLATVEEAVQDALLRALQQWPYRGVPDNPAAWLFRVARNGALDRLRHQRVTTDKAPALSAEVAQCSEQSATASLTNETPPLDDDQLGMMFLTCHPVLPRESRVALTLKLVGGFSVGEIARAFLAQESTIAQRLVRAKRTLRDNEVAFGAPDAVDLVARLDSVLEAIYLMFNEGYAATAGDALVREDISGEAIRLAALVTRHPVTAMPQAHALLALLLLHASRFKARVSSDGELFLLRDQDRSLWDRALIGEGLRALDRAACGHALSAYHLQAEIASCHAIAPTWQETDWPRIVHCYDLLLAATASPIVALNRAIARGRISGPLAAIADIDQIASDPLLASYPMLPAVLAELWREAGDHDRATMYYRKALAVAGSAPERRFLASRLEQI